MTRGIINVTTGCAEANLQRKTLERLSPLCFHIIEVLSCCMCVKMTVDLQEEEALHCIQHLTMPRQTTATRIT